MIYDSMGFDCVFRPAEPSDYDELRRFLEARWIELYSPHVLKRSVERFVREDGAGQHLHLYMGSFELALVDDCIVGSTNRCDDCITAFFVAKRYRVNGIGSCLLHNAESSGGSYLEVAAFNTRAISFYQARGWSRAGTFNEDVFGTGISSLSMTKRHTV
ncbi:GNAT family N-acetyltransferase [Sinorhizobium meliloti]|nr:GNAT family N-acetyltransferase [Sinorhizobium meliloti]MDW9654095.1 GNAT family N-acetyltransferase [Sinorhizobium meliloti]MDW9914509.1 GNAT family N-acetyltransferase [Sinorhizobium meliloti]MDW9937975.1 GNAT family N-acetyltransferase [Sinorhizobium meliloti]MDW9945700.1 GNAT family N-acetyltransferase [Sinorhizobium meliloti]